MSSATILDIAKACGVNASTVSRALHDDPKVRRKTKEKILKCAEKLNYSPNLTARALVSGKTKNLWLLLPNLFNPIEQEETMQLSRCVRDAGYDLMIVLYHGDAVVYSRLLEQLNMKVADGAFILPPTTTVENLPVMEKLAAKKLPLIFLDRHPDTSHHMNTTAIVSDNITGAALLTKTLLDNGAKNIIHFFTKDNSAEYERTKGVLSVKSKNIPGKTGLIGSSYNTMAGKIREYIANNQEREFSAAVFDGWFGSTEHLKNIFTIHQNFEEMAKKAVETMLIKVNDPDAVIPKEIRIPMKDIIRIK